MKRLLGILMVLVMLFSLAACSTVEDASDPTNGQPSIQQPEQRTEPLTVTFWHSVVNDEVYAAFEKVVNEFNEGVGKEKNIYVELVQYSSGAELNTAITGAIMSKSAPNIVMGSSIYMVEYAKAGALVNLTPYIEDPNYGIDMSDFYDCWLLNCNNYDDARNYYCMPILAYSEVLYYNEDFFEENGLTVPTTWDEAEKTARTASEIIGKGALGWDNAAKMFSTLAEQTGVGYTDSVGNLLFDDDLDTVLNAVQWYVDLVKEGTFRTPGDSYYFSGPFANQEIPMYIGSGVEGAYIDGKISPDNSFTWNCAPVPYLSDGTPATFSESSLLGILDLGENDEARLASWEFIKYFESTDAVRSMASAGAYIPVLKSVAGDEEWLANASAPQRVGVEQMDRYYAFYGFDNGEFTSSAIYTDLKSACENILDNNADLKETINDLLAVYGQ